MRPGFTTCDTVWDCRSAVDAVCSPLHVASPMPKAPARRKTPPKRRPTREKRRLWLTVSAEMTTKPVLWMMSRRFDVIFNIRNSSITNEVGLIALELEGDPKTVEGAIRWFRRQGVQVDPVELSTMEG
ncbi:MAG: Ferredoxin [Verrucomicrobiota bacterium]|jgi:ABC-type methionine transport system ATPase subunit